MTRDEADHYGIDLNDPDMHEPRRCRHRDGDPNCMCHPEVDEPEPEIDPEEQFDRDLIAFRAIVASAHYGVPRWKTPENHISNAEIRGDLDALFEKFQANLATLKAKWLTNAQG